MRNAATYDDIGFEEPGRRTTPRKPRGSTKKKKKKGRRFNVDMQKVARYSAIGMSATLAIGIMVNALLLQKGHHPAPLFGKVVTLAEPAPKPVPPAPAALQVPDNTDTAPAAAQVPLPPVKPHHADTAAKSAGDDQIARLLKASGDAAPTDKVDAIVVLRVQQALVKLGFVLKPNGTLGPATKKAIEMFEKDRHLPVKGEITRRLVKILGAESGLKID